MCPRGRPTLFDRAQAGFSRREIGVVIALVVIVGAIGAPLLLKQKEGNARLTSLNNLQQWGIALNLYLIENDNRLPHVGMKMDGEPNLFAWYNAMPVYLSQRPYSEQNASDRPAPGKTSLWMDPAAKKSDFPEAGPGWFSYAMNRWLQPDEEKPSYKIYEIADPGGTVFLVETALNVPGALPRDARFRHAHPRTGEPAAQVLFCDGHAAAVSKKDLLDRPGIDDPEQGLGAVNWIPFYRAPRPVE